MRLGENYYAKVDLSYTINSLNTSASFYEVKKDMPEEYSLEQNYPNPFNPITQIRYQIARNEEVELIVYNLIGEKMLSLVNEQQTLGMYVVEFDASILASGVYFYHLKAGDFNQLRKMVLIR